MVCRAILPVLCLLLAASRVGSVEEYRGPTPASKEGNPVDVVMAESWALESGEYRPELLRDLALRWKGLKRLDQALHLLGPVLNSDKAGSEDSFQSGYLLHRLGCHEPALDAYGQALVMNPAHPEAHYNLALLLQRIGDVDGAVYHFGEVLRMRPAYEPTYFDLVMLFLASGRQQEADDILSAYLEAGSDSLALGEAFEILRSLRNGEEPDSSR